METSNLKNEPISDLYTIPSFSSWFSWGNIHEIEKISLQEFFDGSSISRSPRIYKEYRDFIISKFREDPSRPRLTFTELRKSLVGDVSSLNKVFTFLEKWGLINFTGKTTLSSASAVSGDDVSAEKESKWTIRFEEGPPHGVRVVAAPNSLKPVMPPPPPAEIVSGAEVAEIGTKFPPLASYSNLFEEVMIQEQGKKCGSCKESCDSGYYELIKDQGYALCKKCFDNASYGDDKSIADFKFVDHKSEVVWTQAETLLLLESVLKHGDDWELVAENVKTKTKLDCIHKLLQLPFGDFLLGSSFVKNRVSDANGAVNSVKKVQISSSESHEIVTIQDDKKMDADKHKDTEMEIAGPDNKNEDEVMAIAGHDDKHKDMEMEIVANENKNEDEIMANDGHDDKSLDDKMETTGHDNKKQYGKMENAANDDKNQENAEELGRPHKRRCTVPVSDASSSLMNQVARLSTIVGPHVTASAAEAAVAELCYENGCTREIFDDDNVAEETGASPITNEQKMFCFSPITKTYLLFAYDKIVICTYLSPPPSFISYRVDEVESADGLKDSMVPELQDTTVQRNVVSLTLRMRALTATALGAAAAHAKLLANQEEREIEHLLATIMETQLKKLQSKAKHLEYLKLSLEKQHDQSEEFKESLVTERINVLQEIFSGGSKSKDFPTLQPQSGSAV